MRRLLDRAPDPDVARELDALDRALTGEAVDPDLAELADLARALREDRPRPREEFRAELDAGAARGFTRPRARRGRPARPPPLLPALGAAAAVVGVVVAGSTTRGGQNRG